MLIVSILARPEGRALPVIKHETEVIKHVSILARPEGRALQSACNDMIHIVIRRALREPNKVAVAGLRRLARQSKKYIAKQYDKRNANLL